MCCRFNASPRLQRFVHWTVVLNRISQNVSVNRNETHINRFVRFACTTAFRKTILIQFPFRFLPLYLNVISYGYVTNSRIKFIIVVDAGTALRENDVRTVSSCKISTKFKSLLFFGTILLNRCFEICIQSTRMPCAIHFTCLASRYSHSEYKTMTKCIGDKFIYSLQKFRQTGATNNGWRFVMHLNNYHHSGKAGTHNRYYTILCILDHI